MLHLEEADSPGLALQSGKLSCQWALLADPQLGYGITTDSDEPPVPARMSARDKL